MNYTITLSEEMRKLLTISEKLTIYRHNGKFVEVKTLSERIKNIFYKGIN